MGLSLKKLMRSKSAMVLGAAALAFTAAAPASAAITTYTNRAAWLSAVNSPVFITDYENELISFAGHTTPWTNLDSWTHTTIGSAVTIQVLPSGQVNSSQEIHFRDFGSQVRFTPPSFRTPLYAFGFDYGSAIEQWEVTVPGGGSYPLAFPFQTGFFGVISTTPIPDFVLTSPSNVQGGISIDDLTVPVPTPGSAALVGMAGIMTARRRRRD